VKPTGTALDVPRRMAGRRLPALASGRFDLRGLQDLLGAARLGDGPPSASTASENRRPAGCARQAGASCSQPSWRPAKPPAMQVPHHFIRRGWADWNDPEAIVGSLVTQVEARVSGARDPDSEKQLATAAWLAAALRRSALAGAGRIHSDASDPVPDVKSILAPARIIVADQHRPPKAHQRQARLTRRDIRPDRRTSPRMSRPPACHAVACILDWAHR
jgi:hypothetical protein